MLATQYGAPENTWFDLKEDESGAIAETMRSIHVPEEHEGAANLDIKVGKGKARGIEGVEIFNGMVPLAILDLVNTVEGELLPRELGKDSRVEVIHSVILGGEDGALQEVLMRLGGRISNGRVDGIHEGLDRVLGKVHGGREGDEGADVSVLASTHFQQPLSKGITLWRVMEVHVPLEMQEGGVPPEGRAA